MSTPLRRLPLSYRRLSFLLSISAVNLINNTDHLYPQLIPIPYPKAGEQNPSCRIGVVKIEGGGSDNDGGDIEKNWRSNDAAGSGTSKINWIHLPGDPRHHYIASLDWIPDSDQLVFQRLNRLQNTVHVVIAEHMTGKIRVAFTDRDDAWIDTQSAAWYGGKRAMMMLRHFLCMIVSLVSIILHMLSI